MRFQRQLTDSHSITLERTTPENTSCLDFAGIEPWTVYLHRVKGHQKNQIKVAVLWEHFRPDGSQNEAQISPLFVSISWRIEVQ